jgi:hypothetical protein
MTLEYDCGARYEFPVALADGQTLLANAPLGDTLIAMADANHGAACDCGQDDAGQPTDA